MNQTSPTTRNLLGLYSAWRLDDEAQGDPTERRPDFDVEVRIATFIVEPSDILKLSAGMARREAFPFDAIETEEIGTCFVDDAVAISMESLDGWFDAPATGNLELAKRTTTRFTTLGRTRFITDPLDLAATLKRHGLPKEWATDRSSQAWAPAPHLGPSFGEFAERLRAFDRDDAENARRQRRRGEMEL